MAGKPMLLKDLERLRPHLNVPAFDRVRVIIGADDNNLRLDLECIACEDLLEWDASKGWWVCPGCQQETTDREGADLLRACYTGLGEVLGETRDGETDDSESVDEGKGIGRWVQKVTGISGR